MLGLFGKMKITKGGVVFAFQGTADDNVNVIDLTGKLFTKNSYPITVGIVIKKRKHECLF